MPLGRVRVAHAIEHATVGVLHQRFGRRAPVVALSDPVGFTLVSPYTAAEVEAAVQEAVSRLQEGEESLAITDLCGSNLAVAGLLGAGAALGAAGRRPVQNFPLAVAAATVAALVAPAAGRWVQRTWTVDPDIGMTAPATVRPLLRLGRHHLVRVALRFS